MTRPPADLPERCHPVWETIAELDAPTKHEIAAAVDLAAPTVRDYIEAIQDRGYAVSADNHHRYYLPDDEADNEADDSGFEWVGDRDAPDIDLDVAADAVIGRQSPTDRTVIVTDEQPVDGERDWHRRDSGAGAAGAATSTTATTRRPSSARKVPRSS